MGQVVGFTDLKVDQRVKVKGQAGEGGKFIAVEVGIKPQDDEVSLEAKIQGVDLQKNSLKIMSRDLAISNNVMIKNIPRQLVTLRELKAGDVVKIKGNYSRANGFVPAKIKMQEPRGFTIDELQGPIGKIDQAGKTLELLGFTIVVNEKTEIEGF